MVILVFSSLLYAFATELLAQVAHVLPLPIPACLCGPLLVLATKQNSTLIRSIVASEVCPDQRHRLPLKSCLCRAFLASLE